MAEPPDTQSSSMLAQLVLDQMCYPGALSWRHPHQKGKLACCRVAAEMRPCWSFCMCSRALYSLGLVAANLFSASMAPPACQ